MLFGLEREVESGESCGLDGGGFDSVDGKETDLRAGSPCRRRLGRQNLPLRDELGENYCALGFAL